MSTMINNLKTPYYYCTQNFSYCGTNFWIGWEYPKDYVDKFRNIDKRNFSLVGR